MDTATDTTIYTVNVVGGYTEGAVDHGVTFTRQYVVTIPTVEDIDVYVSDVLEDAVYEPLHTDPTFPVNRVFDFWDVQSWIEH